MKYSINDEVTILAGPRRGQVGRVIGLPTSGGKSQTYTILVNSKGVLLDGSEITKSPDSEAEAGLLETDHQINLNLG